MLYGKGKVNVNGKVVSLQKYISIFTPHKSGHKAQSRWKSQVVEPVKVKFSCCGVKMSRSANLMTLSYSLVKTGDLFMSIKGNRTVGVVSGPKNM